MYQFISEIHNDQNSSYIPDVAFHPNGSIFAACYRDNYQVRVYDSNTRALLRTYRNPEARLDFPHGVTFTDRHMIVSNKLNPTDKPSIINVYRIDDPSDKPVTVFTTPIEHLREAHSFEVNNRRLVVTYCNRGAVRCGAIVTYIFDDETGTIEGPTNVLVSNFILKGDPKGMSFTEDGTKVLITFSEIDVVAIFAIDDNGKLSNVPTQILKGPQFSRPENICLVKDSCVVANTTSDTVNLYKFDGNNLTEQPIQVIRDHLSFPHDACLSPDKKLLVASNYGLKVFKGQPQWLNFLEPRSDKLTFYELQE